MKFIAAAVQMLACGRQGGQFGRGGTLAARTRRIKARGWLSLPEVFIWRGNKKLEREFAEPIPGPTSNRLGRAGARVKYFPAGGLDPRRDSRRARKPTTPVCSSILRQDLASYRKIHLFDVDLANGVSLRESETRAHGADVVWPGRSLAPWGYRFATICVFPSSIVE